MIELDILDKVGTKESHLEIEEPQLKYLMTQFEQKDKVVTKSHEWKYNFHQFGNSNLTKIMVLYHPGTLFYT